MSHLSSLLRHIIGRVSIFINIIKGLFLKINSNYSSIQNDEINFDFFESIKQDNSILIKLFSNNINSIEDAYLIIDGNFKIFNVSINANDYKELWRTDFISGKSSPLKPNLLININKLQKKGFDIIIPWELSRFQFVPTIINAYRLTQDIKYVEFFEKIFDDWIGKNPYKIGVNWKTFMDAGIRIINIGLAYIFFEEKISNTKKELYLKVIKAHYNFIVEAMFQNKLQKKHNHYMAGIASLSFLCQFFIGDDFSKVKSNIESELSTEIIHQFNSDGVNIESANHYHQLTLEAVLFSIYFLYGNEGETKLNVKVKERILNAIKFVDAYMSTFNYSPQFGDSDDGRIIIYKDYFTWMKIDHNFILEISSLIFNNSINYKLNDLITFYDSKIAFLRKQYYSLGVSNSINSDPIYRGHNHCDKASFILSINNKPVFIDSGTFCYTSNIKSRNEFKMTRAHNVVMIDKEEQAYFNSTGAFSPPLNIDTEFNSTNFDDHIDFMISHNGYRRFPHIEKLNRVIRCYESEILVEDIIEGSGIHLIEIILNLHPNILFEQKEREVILFKGNMKLCMISYDKSLKFVFEKAFYSPGYNEKLPTNRIIFFNNVQLPFSNQLKIRV